MLQCFCLAWLGFSLPVRADGFDPLTTLDQYDVSWNEPSKSSLESMPLGNGDLSLNVWAEPDGSLLFYIGKSDAWSEAPARPCGLMKLGRIRVTTSPAVLTPGAPFQQVLKLSQGLIEITEGTGDHQIQFRLWVDALHPVIHLEASSKSPALFKVSLEDWRTQDHDTISADTIISGLTKEILWYHRDKLKPEAAVANLTFGGLIQGENWTASDATTLTTTAPLTQTTLSITALTSKTETAENWITQLRQTAATAAQIPLNEAWSGHVKWWQDFWQRSWIFLTGDVSATPTTQGYVLQKFVTACAGRGSYPIKFNGSLFVVDHPDIKPGKNDPPGVTADYRAWGGQYWFQNTRAMYWPRMMAGDFDFLLPLFHMYEGELQYNAPLVKQYYGHEGSYFAETANFWGGIPNIKPQQPGLYTLHYFTPVLELTTMMLDDYEYTGDEKILRDEILPVATQGLAFFKNHFPRDADGRLLLDPDNAIEMYWKVHDPAPDIAALHSVLGRLLALPPEKVDPAVRADWQNLLTILPDLPQGVKNGKAVLLPYTGEQNQKPHNSENPELYAIYPYRLYGLGLPHYQLAADTFNERNIKATGCWVQDPIQSAMLGLTDLAQKDTIFDLTRRDPQERFPAFWDKGHDYMPDEDNGGNGENGLQWMLLMPRGQKIYLLPAWPKNWNAHFKLHAPYQTTLQGRIENGQVLDLVVTPPERSKDVIVLDDATKAQLMQQ